MFDHPPRFTAQYLECKDESERKLHVGAYQNYHILPERKETVELVHPMMKEIGGLITQPLDWNRFFDLTDSVGLVQARIDRPAPITSGIADMDKIRAEVRVHPTDASNVLSRRSALYRWWRLLWHQGYDMNMDNYDATWNTLLNSPGVNGAVPQAVNAAYAALEDIMANGTVIPEVTGAPDASERTTKTDWPVYHGTDGSQTGFSPDAGPSQGKIAWRVAKGNFWYANPVIENGRVYTASPGADVMAYCLDETTGDVIWNGRQMGTQVYETPGSIFSPVVSSNKVLFTTGWWQAGTHKVLNKQTGKIESRLAAGDTAGGGTSQLMVYKHNRWNVILADATTGEGVWQEWH